MNMPTPFRTSARGRSGLVVTLAALVICAAIDVRTPAVGRSLDRTNDKLDMVVHIPDGSVTVKRLAKLLCEQTGTVIEAPAYLEDRTLLFASRGVNARSVLDMVAALEGWRWFEVEPNRYRLARPTVRLPKNLDGVPAAIQSALPKDVRAFIGLPESPPVDRYQGFGHMAEFKLTMTVESVARELLDSLKTERASDMPTLYSDLDERQRQQLVLAHFLREFHLMGELLFDDFSVHRMDPALSTIELQQGYVLMVDMIIDKSKGRNVGFGTAVAKPPNP